MRLVAADLARHRPATGWHTRTDLSYGPGRDGRFDVVLPDGPGPHPFVVWVHGGGWHFGDKSDVRPYLELLASRGIAGAVVNYPLAPGASYPAAPSGVNEAIRHLVANAATYRLDPNRVVLAGDSAGAQIAAELAVLTTSPAYAATSALSPALTPAQLRGTLFFCGIFDPVGLNDSDRMFEAVLESAMWSLTRTRNWSDSAACAAMRVRQHATADFPATFLSAGQQDPLTRQQHTPFAARLRELDVDLTEHHPDDSSGPVVHEYQFRLGTLQGQEAFERAVEFLQRVLRD